MLHTETQDKPLPVVVYLHNYSYSYGYAKSTYPGFSLNKTLESLLENGFAVFAFDLAGFGSRQKELKNFYKRYPHASFMAKYLQESRSAIALVQSLDVIDSSRAYVLGHELGATVASLLNLKDEGVKGAVLFDPFHAYYQAGDCLEGMRFLYKDAGIMPRLGFFAGEEKRLPFDFSDLASLEDCRRVYVFSRSRHNDKAYLLALQKKLGGKLIRFVDRDQGMFVSDIDHILRVFK